MLRSSSFPILSASFELELESDLERVVMVTRRGVVMARWIQLERRLDVIDLGANPLNNVRRD